MNAIADHRFSNDTGGEAVFGLRGGNGCAWLDAERQHPVREGFRVLRSRKWWVLGVLLGLLSLTALGMLIMTPVYRGRVLLQITEDHALQRLGDNDPVASLLNRDADRFLATQVGILTSRSLAWQVIETLRLQEHPDFKSLADQDPAAAPHKIKHDLIDLFLTKKLSVYPVRESFLVEVYFKSSDPELASRVPNLIAKEYMRLAINRREDSYSLVREWLDGQLKTYSHKVQVSQKKLYDFGQQADFFSLDDKENLIMQKYVELGNLLTKAQSDRLSKEAQFRQIQEKGADSPPITNNPLIIALRQELATQEAKAAGLGTILLAGHPDLQVEQARLKEIRGRLQNEVNRLKTSIKADYEAAKRAEKLLAEAFNQQKEEVANLQTNLVNFQILKRDVQATEKLYQSLLNRMGEAAVASTMVPSTVALIDPADLPGEPYFPRPGLFLALAGILGLGFGIGAAFLVESLDNSLKSETDLERFCRLPPLGHIPRFGAVPGSRSRSWRERLFAWAPGLQATGSRQPVAGLVCAREPDSLIAESFRQLGFTLMFARAGHPPGTVLITSPNPQEGKSTLAGNLAYFLALEGSRRVVLVDCDLRRPQLHKSFERPLNPGLTDYLTGNAGKEAMLQTLGPELAMIPAGTVAPNPAELLISQRFAELLAELRQAYDHVILDSPPLLGFADARILAPLVDGVLLVCKQGFTSREAAMRTCKLLGQVHANLLGGILNHVDPNGSANYAYYRSYLPRPGRRNDARLS
jgi:capsular exopolysaccharide synthesis family protein